MEKLNLGNPFDTKKVNFPLAVQQYCKSRCDRVTHCGCTEQSEPQTCKLSWVQVTPSVWLMCANKHAIYTTWCLFFFFRPCRLVQFASEELTFQVFFSFFPPANVLCFPSREGIPSLLGDTLAQTCSCLPRGKPQKTNYLVQKWCSWNINFH